jgi:hypothetical protein
MRILRLMFAALGLLAWGAGANAQSPTRLGVPTSQGGIQTVGDPALVSTSVPLPVYSSGSSFTNVTTNDDTVVKSSPGTFAGISVNTAGTTSTAVVYDNTACSGTVVGTFSTVTVGFIPIGAAMRTGICVTTAGGAAADITVYYH